MNNKSLATVLAKVVGLWIIIPGIARIISDIIYVLLSVIGLGYAGNPFQVLWIAITHFGIDETVRFAIGLLLIIKTQYIVQKILRISAVE